MGKRRRWSEREPERKGDRTNRDHGRHEIGRDPVREPGERRLRRLRFFHEANDPSQGHLAPNLDRLDSQTAGPIEGGTNDEIAWLLVHRKPFACEHGFVHRRGPVAHDPVHWHLFTRPHHDDITDADLLDRDVLLAAIADNPRLSWLQADQSPDRLGGTPFRPHLHQPSEQNQGDDRGRGVEVHGRSQAARHKELRSQSGDQAV